MFSHITLGTDDLERARRFYDAVMPTLGLTSPFALPGTLVFGNMTGPKLSVVPPFDGNPATTGNGTHAALTHGGSDEGAPGLRPQYHPH